MGNKPRSSAVFSSFQFFVGPLGDAPLNSDSIDAVVIWNTFDQISDPDALLAIARRVLNSLFGLLTFVYSRLVVVSSWV